MSSARLSLTQQEHIAFLPHHLLTGIWEKADAAFLSQHLKA